MRILCCFAQNFRPETQDSLRCYAPKADVIDVTGDDQGYWNAVRERWNDEDDLVIVEQDIEFNAEELDTFRTCPEPWCLFGYHHIYGQPGRGQFFAQHLGFTRFRAMLMSRVPIKELSCNADGTIHWANLDSRILHTSWRYGYRPHVHGEVNNYNYG